LISLANVFRSVRFERFNAYLANQFSDTHNLFHHHHHPPHPLPKPPEKISQLDICVSDNSTSNIHTSHSTMVEPMDIDHNGVHEQATPDESITEQSSVKGEDTPESTDVTPATPTTHF
jgi:hypothetical protein